MEATRPLLGHNERDVDEYHENGTAHRARHPQKSVGSPRRRASLLIIDDASDESCCSSTYRLLCCISTGDSSYSRIGSPSSGYKEIPHREHHLLSNGTTSSTGSSTSYVAHHSKHTAKRQANSSSICSNGGCWKWMFPDRISDYDDFAASEEIGEIHYIQQKTREFFDATHPEDAEMVHHLWNALFPTLPYDSRVNPRWRDVGFQNDDPASDFRSSGRFGLKMLLYFADHMNDEFKRLVRDNRFPVCLCAINVIEMLLIHLNLKDPLPLICPCCGTDNAELDASNPGRDRPELRGFISILNDCSWSRGRPNSITYSAEWPVETAFAQIFMHAMIVLDTVWKHKLHQDPTITLMHFRDALYDTRKKVVAFLSRTNSPVDLAELSAWSARYKHATSVDHKKKTAKTCI